MNIVGSEMFGHFNLRVLIVSGVDGQNQHARGPGLVSMQGLRFELWLG